MDQESFHRALRELIAQRGAVGDEPERALMFGRAYVQCPVAALRRALAVRLHEAEITRDDEAAEPVVPTPAVAAWRAWLDEATTAMGWAVAAAVALAWLGRDDDLPLLVEHVPEERREDVVAALRTCAGRWRALEEASA